MIYLGIDENVERMWLGVMVHEHELREGGIKSFPSLPPASPFLESNHEQKGQAFSNLAVFISSLVIYKPDGMRDCCILLKLNIQMTFKHPHPQIKVTGTALALRRLSLLPWWTTGLLSPLWSSSRLPGPLLSSHHRSQNSSPCAGLTGGRGGAPADISASNGQQM